MAERERALARGEGAWQGLTLEAVISAALVLSAAFVRFYALGRWPLLHGEATQALAAWRFLNAQAMGVRPVPALFDGALVGFFALGASDAVARALPAALGTGLALVPIALRRRLGAVGALAATFLLAFSPILVYFSRTLDGAMPGLAGLGAVLVAADLAGRGRMRQARLLGIGGLALALTSSPWTYTFLLAMAAYGGLGWLAARRGEAWPGWEAAVKAGRELAGERWAWGVLALVVALISTAGLLNIGGLQGTANLLAAWLGRLAPGGSGGSWGYPLGLLLFYELGGLVLGIWGLVGGLRRRDLWAGFLGLWALMALFLATLSGARDPGPVAFVVLPLALLGGLAVERIVAHLTKPQPAWTAGCLAAFSALLGFWWLQAASYFNPQSGVASSSYASTVWAVVALMPLLLLAVGLVFWFWVGRAETAYAVALLGLGLAACFTLRSSVSVNFANARDAREPLVVAPSSQDLRDLVAFLEDWSSRKALDQHALTLAVDSSLDPLVPWYLRDFRTVRLRRDALQDTDAGAVISGGDERPAIAGYAGTTYRLWTYSDAPLGTVADAAGWWLLRIQGGATQAVSCRLWVKP